MKLIKLKLKNFRGYKDEITVDIDDMTVFVGRNDIGKSTVLEALDIFFNENKGIIKIDKDDINKDCLANDDRDIVISCTFSELPDRIVLDAANETNFKSEYLLNSEDHLEIIKKYPNGNSTAKVYIKALHPTNQNCSDLLIKKQRDYQKIIKDNNIGCLNQTVNAVMRKAIWEHFQQHLQLQEIEIDASKEDAKNLWEKIQVYLPICSLFQSDRKNSDGDSEVQDPLKEAVKQILKEEGIAQKLKEVAKRVDERLKEVSNITLEKLREMNHEIASSLNPVIPAFDALSWSDVFKKVSISGDDDIPINKRGSGVKRLILLNFFRAEAERRKNTSNSQSIIYAFEEPETSQHSYHQKLMIDAFKELAKTPGVQVLLTTHSSTVVKGLDFDHLRLIAKDEADNRHINKVEPGNLPYPSLNEINYVAFRHLTEEYHNELHGFLEAENLFGSYKAGKDKMHYIKIHRGEIVHQDIILTEYIRHQIHHPENTLNPRYSFEQLEQSVNLMRAFIMNLKVD